MEEPKLPKEVEDALVKRIAFLKLFGDINKEIKAIKDERNK